MKNKNSGNTFHARVNTYENLLMFNTCLKPWSIWPCEEADHFGYLCQW